MANFKYNKVPMGHRQKFIKINRLSNYALQRLAEGKFTWDEKIAFRKMFKGNKNNARIQATEILQKRG